MNSVDAMVLILLAFADLVILVALRRRRARQVRIRRMYRTLAAVIRRELRAGARLEALRGHEASPARLRRDLLMRAI